MLLWLSLDSLWLRKFPYKGQKDCCFHRKGDFAESKDGGRDYLSIRAQLVTAVSTELLLRCDRVSAHKAKA